MTTRAEQITAEIFSLLDAAPPLADGNVSRSRLRAVALDQTLAIVVMKGPDVRQEFSTIGNGFRQLTVTVEIYARGDTPDLLADPLIESVVDRVLQDRNLGGLSDDITVGSVTPDWEARDTDLVVMSVDFNIDYEIDNESL